MKYHSKYGLGSFRKQFIEDAALAELFDLQTKKIKIEIKIKIQKKRC